MWIALLFTLKTAVGFLTSIFAPRFIPYLGHFSHPSTLDPYQLPHWIKAFAQFDGIFYLRIAQHGYSQFEQAFFPLYPLLIQLLAPVFADNRLLSGFFIAHASFLGGLLVFQKYLKHLHVSDTALRWTFVLLLLFPTSFFFGAVYTEGLFFLLVVATYFFLRKNQLLLAAVCAYLASVTRLAGVFLIFPFILTAYPNWKKSLWTLAPVLGLATYMLYLFHTTGDPLAFFSSQEAFGAGRSTQLILLPQVLYRYIKILTTIPVNLSYWVALLELLVFVFVFTILLFQLKKLWKSKDKHVLSLNLFSLSNILLPTLTGTLSSIPRYALLSLSFFIFLGQIKNHWIKTLLAVIFALIQVVLVALFSQGYFVS